MQKDNGTGAVWLDAVFIAACLFVLFSQYNENLIRHTKQLTK